MSAQVAVPQAAIAAFCQKYHIRKLALFGSVLRDDFTDQSDIDLLYELEDGHHISFFELVRMEEELSAMFDGRKVDLVSAKYLNRHIRPYVMQELQVVYEQA